MITDPPPTSGPSTVPGFRFQSYGNPFLLFATQGDGVEQRTNQQVLFVPTKPSSVSWYLRQAWYEWGGVFVLLGGVIASQAAFLAGLRRLLADPAFQGTRVLWISNPSAPDDAWSTTSLRVAVDSRVTDLVSFGWRSYGLSISPASSVTPVDNLLDGRYATSGCPALVLSPPPSDPEGIYLTVGYGAERITLDGLGLAVPLFGPLSGCLSFPLAVPMDDGSGHAVIDLLDVGCRYFYSDPTTPGSNHILSVRYPVFDTSSVSGTPLVLTVSLDPSAPLAAGRSYFEIKSGLALTSFYRTTLGYPVSLTPGNACRLQFCVRPRTKVTSPTDPLYLTPSGCFVMGFPKAAGDSPNFLCGIGGLEYIALPTQQNIQYRLAFVAGQPAFAASFDPQETSPIDPGTRLGPEARTSWAAITPTSGELSYFAQPQGAALYSLPSGLGDAPNTSGVLDYFPIRAGRLALSAGAGDATYPLAAFSGLQASLSVCSALEAQVLSPLRRHVVYQLTQAAPAEAGPTLAAERISADPCNDASAVTAVTPQGLIARLSQEGLGTWSCLQLAKLGTDLLAFENIVDPLRSALLTNHQFVVISDPRSLASYFTQHHSITIQDWVFNLATEQWNKHGTVVIIKNHPKSLQELVTHLGSWTMASTFNGVPTCTQTLLQQIITNARQRAHPNDHKTSAEPDLDFFVDTVVASSNWNGILFLNAYVPLNTLPEELQGLAAGIDPAKFYAHHLGINQSSVTSELAAQDSSLFGLIDYSDQLAPPQGGGVRPVYQFKVRSLKVLFENSAISRFSSVAEITLNKLFGAPIQQKGADDNVLKLNGFYQDHGGMKAFIFSESTPTVFETVQDPLATEPPLLTSVQIDKAQFSMIKKPLDGGDVEDNLVESRFAFWGSLKFATLEVATDAGGERRNTPYDVFSYDQLSFANLLLEMSFPQDLPSAVTFIFDPSKISFDPSNSTARDNSLAKHFPLTVRGLLAGTAEKKPTDLGFMVTGTSVDLVGLGDPWYALQLDLNLGTLGGLASKAGFVASLAIAWSPNSKGYSAFVGLKLPGSSGGNTEISIQGVLKMKIYNINLKYVDGAFLLILNGMVLTFFGRKLPPGGSFDFYIFGDPNDTKGSSSLGWYGAYLKDKTSDSADEEFASSPQPTYPASPSNPKGEL